jgi:hypothetical protein
VRLGELQHLWIAQDQMAAGAVPRAQAPQRLDRDAPFPAAAHERRAVQVWMELDLVQFRRNRCVLEQ